VRDAIQSELWHGARTDLLQYLLSRGVKVFVFAGAVRDTVLSQECGWTHIKPRDWDIGIAGIPRKEFDGLLKDFGGSKNRYGGFKLFCDGSQSWEIWRQEDTVGLRKTNSPFSLENLLRSFVLSCNAIAFDLDRGHIYDCGALRSISTCEVTILENSIMHDWSVFAAKALSLTFRRPFILSPQTQKLVRMHMDLRNVVHEFQKAFPETSTLFNVLTDGNNVRD
jgi:hypothetical protein